MRIYNLFPLLAGRFSEWRPHLERAADLGFDWVFVNAIQYAGYSGSLYSISDHFRWHSLLVDDRLPPDPRLQWQPAREAGRERGLRFMVDLVINHCAFDSPLLKAHPEWFEWEGEEIVHPHCYREGRKVVWGDLAKFRYDEGKPLEAMMDYWLRVVGFLYEQGFRGFRCDAAYQIPVEVWRHLIARVRSSYADVVFVAETLGCRPSETAALARVGFDAVMNSSKWWDFRESWLLDQYQETRGLVGSISFPESHDTPRLAAEVNRMPAGVKQRYLFSAVFSSSLMMPIGFEFGFQRMLDVVTTRSTHWEEPTMDLCMFIRASNEMKGQSRALQTDCRLELISCPNPNVLLMLKVDEASGDAALVMLNKDSQNHQPFWCDNLYRVISARQGLRDVSPEFRLDYLPTPFEYNLRPGQGIVLVNS